MDPPAEGKGSSGATVWPEQQVLRHLLLLLLLPSFAESGNASHALPLPTPADELSKVQQHLTLLRSEYVKLQGRFHALERSHALAMAAGGGGGLATGDSFPEKIMATVGDLFSQRRYR